MANTFKQPVEEPVEGQEVDATPEEVTPAKGSNRFMRAISSVMDGRFLKGRSAAQQIRFMLFLFAIATLYIANGYYAEKTVRLTNSTTNDIKNMQGEYINLQSKVAQKTTLSFISAQGQTLGLREAIIPPAKLIIQTSNKK